MSDSFADLWSSTTPAKPPAPKLGQSPSLGSPALGGGSPNFYSGKPPPKDIFATLSSPSMSPSSGPSRTITPSGGAGIARTSSAQSRGGVALPGMATGGKTNVKTAADAFSGLGFGNAATSAGNLTIAQRAAREAEERQARLQKQHAAQTKQASAWAGLDALGGGRAFGSAATSAPTAAAVPKEEDWMFDLATPAPVAATKQAATKRTNEDDDWGLSDAFSSSSRPASRSTPQPPPPSKPPTSKAPTIWDFDTLSSHPAEEVSSKRKETPPQSSTPGDFDFGDREDRYDEDSAEEDLLGLDGGVTRKRTAPKRNLPESRLRPSSPRRPQPAPTRVDSPPPHIIGQIVEMGFTPQQARIALAATDSGVDVQSALDTLLSNGAAEPETPAPPRRRYDDDDEPPIPMRRRPQPDSRRTSGREEPPSNAQSPNLQEQADRILASATEIGAGLFSKANAFWNQGKERVQRVYEERAASAGASSAGGETRDAPARDGRPRWMQEAVAREEGDWGIEGEQAAPRRKPQQQARPAACPEPPHQREAARATRLEVKTADLFSDEAPAAYISPFRRRPAGNAAPLPAPAAAAPSPAPRASRGPSPPRLVERPAVSASASEIATSTQHKTAGTEKFKLGQFADAETAYTNALNVLPDGHLLRLPLLTNRALARIRTGQHASAAEDCSAALDILGSSFHPAREKKVEDPSTGAGVDLTDSAVKARRRRAEAAEGREKWADARADWEALAGAEWAPQRVRSEAVAGASRCRKMEAAGTGGGPPPSSRPTPSAAGPSDLPRVKPRPKVSAASRPKPVVQQSGEALARVQAANRAAEAEDDQKYALKDSVDARLLAWRGGKETNLRALLASLDAVLWPELGMPKVGMHELVSPGQVKVKYTRTIARLHPDKLNVANTTLEHRMIANGVFGALNEAWIAFKQ